MKQYVIDELRPGEYDKIKSYLEKQFTFSGTEGIYWIPIEIGLLTDIQREHESCHPLHAAVELEPERVSCELLVRSSDLIRCGCIGYATEAQRNWLIKTIDDMFEKLGIIT